MQRATRILSRWFWCLNVPQQPVLEGAHGPEPRHRDRARHAARPARLVDEAKVPVRRVDAARGVVGEDRAGVGRQLALAGRDRVHRPSVKIHRAPQTVSF